MNRIRKILVRSSGGMDIGFGHVYRVIAVSNIMSSVTEINFLVKDKSVLNRIPNHFKTTQIPCNLDLMGEIQWLSKKYSPSEYVLLIDGYDFVFEYQNNLKKVGFSLIYIDDIMAEEQAAQCVINPSLGAMDSDYTLSYECLGLGPQYAPLRASFLEFALKVKDVQIRNIKNVFVNFGGADAYNLVNRISKCLIQFDQLERVVVLAGVNSKIDRHPKIEVHSSLSEGELIDLLSEIDAAITSASTISYEICSMRIPLLIGWYVDNQMNLFNGLVERELAIGLGNILEINDATLIGKIDEFMRAENHNLVANQIQFFDGRNSFRISKLIFPLLTKLRLRKANNEDVDLVYDWANSADVRSQSLNSDEIPYEDHVQWFGNMMSKSTSSLFIAELNGLPVGQIRFDLEEDGHRISYMVDKAHRGHGFGLQIVAMGLNELATTTEDLRFIAEVKNDNIASIKVFERLGFNLEEKQSEEVNIFVK